jgi:hypothetical protein
VKCAVLLWGRMLRLSAKGKARAAQGCVRGATADCTRALQCNVALSSANVGPTLPQCLQDDDIPGIVRYHTYEVLQKEVDNPRVK